MNNEHGSLKHLNFPHNFSTTTELQPVNFKKWKEEQIDKIEKRLNELDFNSISQVEADLLLQSKLS